MCIYVINFFFSSRRRHTRLQGDWSSDVCSSDLGGGDRDFPRDSGARGHRDRAASVVAALGVRGFLRMLHELAGPAVGDVRALVATIRAEAEGLAGTSRELRQRIVSAADAAEARLAELDAVFEVGQEEVEATVLDVAAPMPNRPR